MTDRSAMIQACLFDIGNVLVSFDYARAFQRLAARTRRTAGEWQAHLQEAGGELETGRLSSGDFVSRAVAFSGSEVSGEDFLQAFSDIFERNEPVWGVMEALRKVIPVHLFSNTSEIHEKWLFGMWPDFHRFHGGFFSWRLGTMKPDDGMYEQAAHGLGVPASSIAYIDDLPANIRTGQRFGFRSHQYDLRDHGALLRFLESGGLPVPV